MNSGQIDIMITATSSAGFILFLIAQIFVFRLIAHKKIISAFLSL